jgi:hypothetical protein
VTSIRPPPSGRDSEDRRDWAIGMSGQERATRLRATGAVRCELTEDLIRRSRRALARSRALLGDAYRVMKRTDR